MLGGDIINKLQETKIQFFFKRENIFSIIPKGPKMYVSFAKTFFHREKNAKKRKYSKIVFAPFGGFAFLRISIIPKGPKMYVSFAKTFLHREKNAKKRKYLKIVFAPFGGVRIFSHL